MSEVKEKLVQEMKDVVTFLEGATVCNEESILILSQHFDNFRLSLKYLPIKNFFGDLPVEIKTQILSYLCDYEAFVKASVCQEWKKILKPRIYENMKEVIIGRHCKNWYKDQCFNPEEMLKASLTLELNIPLKVCHPLEEVEPQFLAKALTCAHELTLDDTCTCCEIEILQTKDEPILSKDQGEAWMKVLEKKIEPMDKVVLKGLDLTYLKDRMLTCLLKKVKTLTLIQDGRHDKVLNFSALTRKLRQNSAGRKLERLNLYYEYNGRLDADLLIDALCTVEKIDLGDNFSIHPEIVKRLLAKMSTGVTTKTFIMRRLMKWVNILSPTELGNALSNMEIVQLEGKFSLEQLEVVRSLPRGYAVQRPHGFYRLGIN